MGTFSKISYQAMSEASTSLKTNATDMSTILTEIKTLFENIGDESTWSGTAANSAKEQFDTLSAKFEEFYTSISDCSQYLDKVVQNYQNVDSIVNGQQ